MSSVAVIDYGMGNLHSIAKALQHAAPEVDVQITSDAQIIKQADRIVFPVLAQFVIVCTLCMKLVWRM